MHLQKVEPGDAQGMVKQEDEKKETHGHARVEAREAGGEVQQFELRKNNLGLVMIAEGEGYVFGK